MEMNPCADSGSQRCQFPPFRQHRIIYTKCSWGFEFSGTRGLTQRWSLPERSSSHQIDGFRFVTSSRSVSADLLACRQDAARYSVRRSVCVEQMIYHRLTGKFLTLPLHPRPSGNARATTSKVLSHASPSNHFAERLAALLEEIGTNLDCLSALTIAAGMPNPWHAPLRSKLCSSTKVHPVAPIADP